MKKNDLLIKAAQLYGFDVASAREVPGHEGGRNLVFLIGTDSVLRVSSLSDRNIEDYEAEIEYIHYLSKGGANVADSIPSVKGNRIEIIDDYHVKSLDWDVTFEVSEKVSPNIAYIGIRAHDIYPGQKDDVNVLDASNSSKLEMPFEWQITLNNGLLWKLDKQMREHEFEIPEYLKVNPKNILLLEE